MRSSAAQRGFANEAGQARVIDRATGRTFTNSIANIFKRRDFNAFWDEDGELCQDVERLLADQVDSPAGRGFVALRRGEFPLPADQREDVARFIAAQLTRGRHFRGTTAAFMGDVGDHVLALMNQHYTDAHWERALGYVPSAEACREMVAQGYTPGKGELLDMMLAPIDDITGQVLGRLWTLLNFRQPCLFTSEEPVTLSGGVRETVGVGTADEVMLPVSTTKALLLTWPGSGLGENALEPDAAVAARLNERTLMWPLANHLLVSPDVDAHPLPAGRYADVCAAETLAVLRGESGADGPTGG